MLPEARRDKLLVMEIGDQLVVYDRIRHRAHRLNRTAAFVWRHCDGRTSVTELATLLGTAVEAPTDARLIGLALRQLDKARLLQQPLPEDAHTVSASRREVVKQLGLVGALAVILPVVTSIAAPTPLMAQYAPGSCRPPNFCGNIPADCTSNNIGAQNCGGTKVCCTP